MRTLLYVPIIHDEADMGSAGTALARRSAELWGNRRWKIHKDTVRGFWESIGTYLLSLDPRRLRVYQDGLAADGEVGRRIVNEAASRGSKNYQLVLDLLDRGAALRKTEDALLLLREYENIFARAQQGSAGEQPWDIRRDREQDDLLTEERDRFIADTIAATLREGELGVLFIGAYHHVISRLAADISVDMVKNREKVSAYFDELVRGRDDKTLEELALYLSAPVTACKRAN